MAKRAQGESVLSRVVRIFETFGPDTPALRVTDIERRAELHVATASRLVDELVGAGWLRPDPDRRIRVGVRLWELASRASPTLGLREAAMPFMEDLHAVVGHHTQLAVLEDREVLFVERLSAPRAGGPEGGRELCRRARPSAAARVVVRAGVARPRPRRAAGTGAGGPAGGV